MRVLKTSGSPRDTISKAFKYKSEVKLQEASLDEEMDIETYNDKLCKILYSTAKETIESSKVIKWKKQFCGGQKYVAKQFKIEIRPLKLYNNRFCHMFRDRHKKSSSQ